MPVLSVLLLVSLAACSDPARSFGGDAGASGTGGRSGTGGGSAGGAGTGGAGTGGAGTGGVGTGGVGLGGTGGGTGGRGGTGGGGTGGGTGGSGMGGRSAGTGGVGGGCSGTSCGTERLCCAGVCVNPSNDPMNCGQCTMRCPAATPYCGGGSCQATPCQLDGGSCGAGGSCCGSTCCTGGQICCDRQGPISGQPVCYSPTAAQPTCPLGCAPLCISDRNLKRDIVPIDPAAILAKVGELPISTWSYIDQPTGVRHLGPMAQDFHARFGLGDDDRTYNSVDAHGVALAAIQALDRLVKQQQIQIRALERRNENLSRRLHAIETGSGQTGN
jgi:hypothetical protein